MAERTPNSQTPPSGSHSMSAAGFSPSGYPSKGPGSGQRRVVFLSISAALALGVLISFRAILAPFLLALVVAYVFSPVVAWMERKWRMQRWIAVLSLYVAMLSVMAGGLFLGIPVLTTQVKKLSVELPTKIHALREELAPKLEALAGNFAGTFGGDDDQQVPRADPSATTVATQELTIAPGESGGYIVHLPENGILVERLDDEQYVIRRAHTPKPVERGDFIDRMVASVTGNMHPGTSWIGTAFATVQAVVRAVFLFFIMLMLSAYLLISQDKILDFFRSLVRFDKRPQFDTLLRRMDRGLSGVVRGQLVICLINGLLSGIGFFILGLPYWGLLTFLATVFSIVPIFGAFISSVPAVIVAMQVGWQSVLFVFLWIVGIHQVEANLLNPKIMGDAAKVHPVLVVFALIAGEHFFGILGALLAVPVLSIMQTLFLHFREIALGMPASASSMGSFFPKMPGLPREAETIAQYSNPPQTREDEDS